MFEHFIFGLPARADSHAAVDVSPLDMSASTDYFRKMSASSSERQSPVADLSSRLGEQCLELCRDEAVSRSYLGSLPSPPFDASFDFDSGLTVDHDFLLHRSTMSSTTTRTASSSARAVAASASSRRNDSIRCRRQQRQLHTQMLCAGTQHKSISALVGDMVAVGDQCRLTTPVPTPALSNEPLSPQSCCSSMDLGPYAGADESFPSEPEVAMQHQDEGFFEASDEDSASTAVRQQVRASVERSQQRPSGIRKHSGGVVMVRRAWDASQGGVLRLPRIRKKIVTRRN